MKPIQKRMARLALAKPLVLYTLARLAYRQKFGIHGERLKGRGKSGMPCEIKVHLTRRCNLNCIMCGQHRHTQKTDEHIPWCNPENELDIETWLDVLDQIVAWSYPGYRPWLDITGGEPTIYRHFDTFITSASEKGFFINLLTNGTTLEKNVPLLIDQKVEAVTISVDGPEEYHDRIRGLEGLFGSVATGIRALDAARKKSRSCTPLISLTCTISKANLAVLDQVVPLAEKLNVDSLVFNNTSFQSRETVDLHNRSVNEQMGEREKLQFIFPSIPEGGFYESEITETDLPVLQQTISRIHAMKQKSLLRISFAPFSMRQSLLKPYYLDMAYPFPKICDFLWKSLRIHPDGTVSPCLGFIAGNVRDYPLDTIWNGAPYKKFRTLVSETIFPGCARCCQRRYTKKVSLGGRSKH